MEKELWFFGKSIGYGAFLVVLYDGIRIIRMIRKKRNGWEALEDVIYWSAAAIFLFSRCLEENEGRIRGYFLLGVLSGAWGWYHWISRFYLRFVFVCVKRLQFFMRRVTIFLHVTIHKQWIKTRKILMRDKNRGAWNEKKKKGSAQEGRRGTSGKSPE